MDAQIIMAGASTGGVILVGIGLIITWKRNGRDQRAMSTGMAVAQAERDQAVDNKLEGIIARLDDKDTGLSAINKAANGMKNHCIQTSTAIVGRLNTAERDIKELKTKK